MPKVCIPMAEGFEEIEMIAMVDVMRRAGIEVVIAGVTGMKAKGGQGIEVSADVAIEEVNIEELDMVVLPGGWGGTQILAENEHVITLLQRMDSEGKKIGAICAAPYALHKAGVLKGEYTCYPSFEEKIGNLDKFHPEKKVVEFENNMTSRGPGTAICFALELVHKLVGKEKYDQLKQGLLVTDYC